ncbi:MAG: Stp1/IreP family PP2C-type Ser/Thr phosphatase [Deltaproteobacteria bacterium]|nr:Stp1/IreP family PP2C-type Ser/Thr phosphatase [Deltaproteobacteria bacterium]
MAGLTTGFAKTSVGRVRQRNEDAFLVMAEKDLYVVADGMGGHQRGDVAAHLCIDAISEWFTGEMDDETTRELVRRVRRSWGIQHRNQANLVASIEYANRLIVNTARQSDAFKGMGTTIVATIFHGSTLFVVYSGDSRVYRFRSGRLRQLSEDHSLVNEYIRLQMIKPSDARTFPYRNVIMKALGLKSSADIEFFTRRAAPCDVYLLCSDGLTDMIEDEEIRRILASSGTLDERCQWLVDAAMDAGGFDNITALLVEYDRS